MFTTKTASQFGSSSLTFVILPTLVVLSPIGPSTLSNGVLLFEKKGAPLVFSKSAITVCDSDSHSSTITIVPVTISVIGGIDAVVVVASDPVVGLVISNMKV